MLKCNNRTWECVVFLLLIILYTYFSAVRYNSYLNREVFFFAFAIQLRVAIKLRSRIIKWDILFSYIQNDENRFSLYERILATRNMDKGKRISAASAHIPEMNLSAKPQNLRVLNCEAVKLCLFTKNEKKICKRYLFKIANTMKCESLARAHAIDIK